jgi:SAM-dependent methyltransferase
MEGEEARLNPNMVETEPAPVINRGLANHALALTRLAEKYDPRSYWEQRLQSDFTLRSVGNVNFGKSYNRWLYRRKAGVIRSIFADTDLQGKRVLEIGCGTGFFIDWYSKRGAEVSGIDITEVSIREISKRFRGEFWVQDITAVAYRPAKTFDIVDMWDVAYHVVDDKAFARAVDNVAMSLKPNGLFICTDWFGVAASERIAPHVKARNLATYKHVLEARGFTLREVKPLYGFLNIPHHWRFDNRLAGIYYALDNLRRTPSSANLSVAVWRYG